MGRARPTKLPVLLHIDDRPGDIAPIGGVKNRQRSIGQRVISQLHLPTLRDRALCLGLEHFDADDANRHQHHAQVDNVTAIAAAVAPRQAP